MSLLENILSSEYCLKCKYCCSFSKKSLYLTPIFEREKILPLEKKYPFAKFCEFDNGNITVDLSNNFHENFSEALCWFNNGHGCILSDDEKPFVCKIWPLRIMQHEDKIAVVLNSDCLVTSAMSLNRIKELLTSSGDLAEIWNYVSRHPEVIENFEGGHEILYEHKN